MTRRKVFIAFAAAVMILVLTAALFVACNDETKTYTVTFKNGETVVKTVSVQDGATIADADVPADLEDTDDAVFEGWFNGDAAFDKTAAITSDVTYTAKWTSIFTVTFKDGDQVVKTAKVKSGEKIASADVPADLENTDDAEFEGWFNGDAAFDADATITANVTYTSKWSGLLTVTFKDGDQVVKTAKVKSGEKIAAADIPTDLADTADAEFEGWFNGDAAFDKDAAITSNATYTAKWTSIYTVTFQNGDQVVKTAKVKSGAVISAQDVPGALADTDYAFLGWFVGDAAYDSSAAVTSDVVVNAKFSTFFKSYLGTWHGATEGWTPVAYTVVVDATSINVTIGSADAQAATSIKVDEDGTVMFKLGETDYRLYANYGGNLCIYESSEIKLSAELAGRVHVSSSDIVGTYETEGGHTIVINKTFAKVDGVLGTGFYYSASSGYSWSIGDNYSSLAYDSSAQAWIYKETSSSAGDKLIVPELVAIDIPAEFIGNWYGTVERFGSTSYFLVKVTADGVFAYTPSTGYAKVGVATEYKDGKLTVVGLDETITASIADGKLAYKSDAAGADYQLTKGTVVVFEHEYSVYYIATVGADGKIDFDTFALEDPQAAAGYTFKGWFSDLDFVTEFNEDATFAESAVFQSKVEKTGYVVTFKKTSSDSDPVIAVVEKTNGKLAADQIPTALTYEDGSVFTGWFTAKGVKAVADLAITADTTFTALAVKESDYAGAWVSTEAGKEITLLVADGKLTFGEIKNVAYTFNEDGSISYGKWGDGSAKYSFVITTTGIKATNRHLDLDGYGFEEDVYTMTALKAISGVAGSYKADNAHRYVITENGLVTTAENSDVFMGYVTGSSNSNFTIVYKTSSSSKVTTVKGARIDEKGNLVLGKKTADAAILIKDLKDFKSYYMSDEGTLYVYTNSDDTITYVFKTSGDKYAYVKAEDIKGKVAEGEIFTITYGLYNGTYKKTNTTQTYKIVNGKLTTAGAEKGEYTAEGKDTLTLNGFGDATLGKKSYKYSINAKNVVVLTGETTFGVTLDSKAKTYAEATGDGFAHAYIDASNSRYTLTFDGFGGVEYKYVGTYGSPQIAYGSYTLGTGSVTVTGANYSYNKTYSVEESGSVIVSTDGKKVLKVAGYVVESKIKSLEGYYVNGDSTIEIVVAEDKTFKLYIDGALVDAKTNWNGSAITYSALDADAAIESAKKQKTEFTITKDGDNIKVSHDCAVGLDMDGYIEKAVKEATYTASTKPSTGTDAFAGTWKTSDGKLSWTFDGKGTVTNEDGNSFAYTIVSGKAKFVNGALDIECSISGNTMTVSYDDGDAPFTKTFTKQAEETLDAFAGTWTYSSGTFVFDGKGTVTVTGPNAGTYAYTVDAAGTTATYYNTAYSETITCKLNSDGSMTVNDQYTEWLNGVKFTKA